MPRFDQGGRARLAVLTVDDGGGGAGGHHVSQGVGTPAARIAPERVARARLIISALCANTAPTDSGMVGPTAGRVGVGPTAPRARRIAAARSTNTEATAAGRRPR